MGRHKTCGKDDITAALHGWSECMRNIHCMNDIVMQCRYVITPTRKQRVVVLGYKYTLTVPNNTIASRPQNFSCLSPASSRQAALSAPKGRHPWQVFSSAASTWGVNWLNAAASRIQSELKDTNRTRGLSICMLSVSLGLHGKSATGPKGR